MNDYEREVLADRLLRAVDPEFSKLNLYSTVRVVRKFAQNLDNWVFDENALAGAI